MLHPVGADEVATTLELMSVAGLAIIGVDLGVPVARIARSQTGANSAVHFARSWPNPDESALVVLGAVAAANRYLRLIGQTDPQNLAQVLDAHQELLDRARQQAQAPWEDLRTEADRRVQQSWARVVGLAQRLADDAGVHGPIV